MKLVRSTSGPVLERNGQWMELELSWDQLFTTHDLVTYLRTYDGSPVSEPSAHKPVGSQEVWAAGVTYFVSRDARMEESADAGNADIYEQCYNADRPELFLKATPHRAVGPGEPIRIRRDSRWNVPEPELTLAITSHGEVFGYTVGNDVSSRDIEGENPLYLPQAKTYDGCASLGPAIFVSSDPLPPETGIELVVERSEGGQTDEVFRGATRVDQIRRPLAELVDYLFAESTFPAGCFLMTGTGIVPPAEFSLLPGDLVHITIEGVGVLTNPVGTA